MKKMKYYWYNPKVKSKYIIYRKILKIKTNLKYKKRR